MMDILERFSRPARHWFRSAFSSPTPAQAEAWRAISEGRHALVVAPTGSGKTLAAFLWAIDRIFREKSGAQECGGPSTELVSAGPGMRAEWRGGESASVAGADPTGAGMAGVDTTGARTTRIVYVSPLKALGVDVERNLRAPLAGIRRMEQELGATPPDIQVGVRSGDTTPSQRQRLIRNPPDILITTPESLYLMLTSRARETLRGVHTVIIDEVHAVAGSKRGAHLAVSLERLDELLAAPAQRIGLSATVRPVDEVARFLGGAAPVEVIAPPAARTLDLTVTVPVEDLQNLPAMIPETEGDAELTPAAGSVWPHIEESVVGAVLQHRSTIVFVNSRRLAERLTSRLNEVYLQRVEQQVRQPEQQEASGATPPVPDRDRASLAPPAQMMGLSGRSEGAPPVLAKAHHGSVSKEQRAEVEGELKSGRLRCVVATSSLELGIDMGAVDLVIQIESPPSAASGLQRVGRAGHQVGEVSRAVFYPKHSGDALHSAVVAERMLHGSIEAVAIPRNPLDILAQQTVAECALGSVSVDEWFATVRRSAPFRALPRNAFDTVLDFLAGRYPSDEFAELRPRIIWDREAGTIAGRPGAQRLAVTSGGTIPNRGLYGVFVAGEKRDARVGELDEEMVYESRVGDVFTLGTTSWRIVEITHDRVNVVPAFGRPGRLPFWRADSLGRPAELGEAMGRFYREITTVPEAEAAERLGAAGLDENAANNVLSYLREQRAATGTLPTDRALTVERGRDDVGDWRIILHSPFGMHVHAPWALAVAARIREAYGEGASAVAGDDGIIVRVPDTSSRPPGAELFVFNPDELEQVVTDEVGGSALFASRFRECAARSLLMPRLNPGKRMPLWQQRQRSAALLEVARRHPDFPILLEAMREVLQDVYDLPALLRLARDVAQDRVLLVETDPAQPSPFARDLLFGYVDQFIYEGDAPLAERRTALLQVDPELLGDLLGRVEMRELLDAGVIAEYEEQLQRLTPELRARGVEGVADLLRQLGPLSVREIAARLHTEEANARGWTEDNAAHVEDGGSQCAERGAGESADRRVAQEYVDELVQAGRAIAVVSAGAVAGEEAMPIEKDTPISGIGRRVPTSRYSAVTSEDGAVPADQSAALRYAAIEDAARLRDALGMKLPPGIPAVFLEPVSSPLDDLVSRYARTHGPFTAGDVAQRFGLGIAVVDESLQRLRGERRVTSGFFLPERPHPLEEGAAQPPGLSAQERRSAHVDLPDAMSGAGMPEAAESSTDGVGGGEASGSMRRERVEWRQHVEWCDVQVLRRLRQRSLAALRGGVEPVPPEAYARFLPMWQHADGSLEGIDGVLTAVEQLAGVPIPASAWESLILPVRVRDYSPAMLDQLTAAGEVTWMGRGTLPGRDGWIVMYPAGYAGVGAVRDMSTAGARAAGRDDARQVESSAEMEARIIAALRGGGAFFAGQLREAVGGITDEQAFTEALWNLVWAGYLTNDTLAPVRAFIAYGTQAHRSVRSPSPRAYRGMGYRGVRAVGAPPVLAGRWSLIPGAGGDAGSSQEEGFELVSGEAALPLEGQQTDGEPTGSFAVGVRASVPGELSSGPEAVSSADNAATGRGWSAQTAQAVDTASALLGRYGVVTRGSVQSEGVPGGFAGVYRVLRGFEEAGHCRRGYFIAGLGAAQFAVAAAVDRLREFADRADNQGDSGGAVTQSSGSKEHTDRTATPSSRSGLQPTGCGAAITLAATDPANPYGAALPWPAIEGVQQRPGRKAGALVVLVAGKPVLYLERGGRTVLQFTEDTDVLESACASLAATVAERHLETLTIEKVNGEGAVFRSALAAPLRAAGFVDSPRGLALYRAY
ncbi:MAG: DEAD/DEAH box helicase [Actinomycetaceae bacterium]|nr:DEAD/DEAH box helicase [Actinomycetaceae bacterium]